MRRRILSVLIVLLMCAAILPASAFAVRDNVLLTEQKVLSDTNPSDNDCDIRVGNWTDSFGEKHQDALRFWVMKADGYDNSESIVYDVSDSVYDAFKGTIVAANNSKQKSSMLVNVYLDGKLAYTSPEITPSTKPVEFVLNIATTSELKVECCTESSSAGYCIVDAKLSFGVHEEAAPQLRDYCSYYNVDSLNQDPVIANEMIYDAKGQLTEVHTDGTQVTIDIDHQYFKDIQYQRVIFYFEYDEGGNLVKQRFADADNKNREETLYFKYKSKTSDDSSYKYMYTSDTKNGRYVLNNIFVDLLNEDTPVELTVPITEKGAENPRIIVYRHGVKSADTNLYPLKKEIIPGAENFVLDSMVKNISVLRNEAGLRLICRIFEYNEKDELVRSLQTYPITEYAEIKTFTTKDNDLIETDSMLYYWNGEGQAELISCKQDLLEYDAFGSLIKDSVSSGYYYGKSALEDETGYCIDYTYQREGDSVRKIGAVSDPGSHKVKWYQIEDFHYEY